MAKALLLILLQIIILFTPLRQAASLEIIKTRPIVYPLVSRYQGEEGVAKILISDKAEILESSGYKRLDDAALYAVSKWEFKDIEEGTKIIVPVVFKLID